MFKNTLINKNRNITRYHIIKYNISSQYHNTNMFNNTLSKFKNLILPDNTLTNNTLLAHKSKKIIKSIPYSTTDNDIYEFYKKNGIKSNIFKVKSPNTNTHIQKHNVFHLLILFVTFKIYVVTWCFYIYQCIILLTMN